MNHERSSADIPEPYQEMKNPIEDIADADTHRDNESGGDCPAAPCSLSENPDWEELKLALNEAIWTKAPGNITLEQAEHAACLAIGYLNQCFEANAKVLTPDEGGL